MKTWKNAEVVELNISETANGRHSWWDEGVDVDIIPGNDYEYTTQTGNLPNTDTGKTNGSEVLS